MKRRISNNRNFTIQFLKSRSLNSILVILVILIVTITIWVQFFVVLPQLAKIKYFTFLAEQSHRFLFSKTDGIINQTTKTSSGEFKFEYSKKEPSSSLNKESTDALRQQCLADIRSYIIKAHRTLLMTDQLDDSIFQNMQLIPFRRRQNSYDTNIDYNTINENNNDEVAGKLRFPRKVAVVSIGYPDNLEDAMMVTASIELINHFGVTPTVPVCSIVEQQQQQQGYVYKCDFEQIGQSLGEGGAILLQPSDDWGDLEPSIHQHRLQVLSDELKPVCQERTGLKVVQLSQNVFYQDEYTWRYEAGSINALGDCFSFIAGSKESQQFVQQIYNKIQVEFSPDIGFLLQPPPLIQSPQYDLYYILHEGQKSTLSQNQNKSRDLQKQVVEVITNRSSINQVTFGIAFQWLEDKSSLQQQSANNQQEIFRLRSQFLVNQIGKGRVLVTDKVHAVVAAVITGIPNVWIDTKDKQISQIMFSAFGVSKYCDGQFLNTYMADDLVKASEIAIKLVKQVKNDE